MKCIHRSLLFTLLLALYVPAVAAPSTKEYAIAINQAGRQRMLSQKMSKEFLLICLQLEAEANRADLGKTVKLFDSTLKRLMKGDADVSMPAPPAPEIAAQLETVNSIWGPFRTAIEKALEPAAVNKEAIQTVAVESLKLVTEMDKAVTLYEKSSREAGIKTTGTVVNVAGRQRMLTQRMSKNILLIALNVEVESARKDLQFAQELFDKSLKGLTDGNEQMNLPPTSNKVIRQQLAQVAELWGKFSGLVKATLDNAAAPPAELQRQVAELNVKLLAECQKVVSSYETETY